MIAKIVEDDPASEFVTQVTISNNQQNPVHAWALRAMDQRQVDLAEKFREEVGIYYSRQEGAFQNLSDEELEEMGIESNKDIRIKQLALTFLAAQGDIANMKQLSLVFESQKLYESTFRTSYLHADARGIVLAYKTGQMLGPVLRKLEEVLPAKYELAISPARFLTWALLLQALFDAKQYPKYVEDYGTSLTKESAFSDVLQQLARSRVAPLVRELCAF